MKLPSIGILILCLSSGILRAQCGFDALHQQRMRTDPEFAASVREMRRQISALNTEQSAEKRVITGRDTVYTIPLVVHVVHNGEPVGSPTNPSDAQIISWINYTDAAFNASWPSYPAPGAGGARTGIRFVLAQTDRDCKRTNGIVRVNASAVPNYTANGLHYPGGNGNGADEMTIRNLSYWGQNNYINVWIVHKIDSSIAGYARYPGAALVTAAFGPLVVASTVQAGNMTLPHELGHSLGLMHTFEGDNDGANCPPTTNCSTTGDLVCDAEPDKRYPSCTATINPCTGTAYGPVRTNFMNYTNCGTDRFTAGQAAVMRTALKYSILSTLSQHGDTPVTKPAMVPATCVNRPAARFAGWLATQGPTSVSFAGITRKSTMCRDEDSAVYVDNSCAYRTDVTAGKSYTLTVLGTGQPHYVKAYLDYNNDGSFQAPNEQIMNIKSSINATLQTTSASVTIPANGVVFNKPLRMRVIVESTEDTSVTGPCAPMLRGQAEDYAVTVVPSVGINPALVRSAATIGPIPADRQLEIRFGTSFTGIMSLLDARGAVVQHAPIIAQDEQALNTASLPPGIYYLILRDGSGSQQLKVQILH